MPTIASSPIKKKLLLVAKSSRPPVAGLPLNTRLCFQSVLVGDAWTWLFEGNSVENKKHSFLQISTEKQLYSDRPNHFIIYFDVTNLFSIIGDGIYAQRVHYLLF